MGCFPRFSPVSKRQEVAWALPVIRRVCLSGRLPVNEANYGAFSLLRNLERRTKAPLSGEGGLGGEGRPWKLVGETNS